MKQSQDALICFVVGGAFLVGAAFAWYRTRRFVRQSNPASGVVVGLREYYGRGVRYAPIISFTGPDGRAVVFTESTASNPPDCDVGDRVRILYRRDDPTQARVAYTSNLYLLAMVFAGLGAVIVLIGILIGVLAGR